jgi:hypothetical protein
MEKKNDSHKDNGFSVSVYRQANRVTCRHLSDNEFRHQPVSSQLAP